MQFEKKMMNVTLKLITWREPQYNQVKKYTNEVVNYVARSI